MRKGSYDHDIYVLSDTVSIASSVALVPIDFCVGRPVRRICALRSDAVLDNYRCPLWVELDSGFL